MKKKHLKVCEIFENYVDDVADCFFALGILFDEVDMRLKKKKTHLVRYHLYRFFFVKKALTDDIN